MSAEQTHERVTAAELAKIERLDREATPGPWTEYVPDFPEYENPGVRHAGDADYGRVARIASRQADAAFIAAARTLLPRLAAELRARREDDAAIGRLLDEAGVTSREGETLLERVAALTVDACASRMTCERLIAERNEQRARAEQAEAKLAALRAPVDVETTLHRLARDIEAIVLESGVTSEVLSLIEGWVRPHVERAARLAREAEGLRAEVYRLNAARVMAEEALDRGRKWHEKRTADLDAARAELAKVVLERDAMAERLRAELEAARDPVDGPEAKLAERTAEIERLKGEAEGLRAEVAGVHSSWTDERRSHRMALRERDSARQQLADMGARRDEAEADLATARAELAKVVLERDAVRLRCDLRIAERDEALQQLTAARAEVERLRENIERSMR